MGTARRTAMGALGILTWLALVALLLATGSGPGLWGVSSLLGPAAAWAAAASRATEIIPRSDEHVAREGELASYAGEELYDYINGGAPQFLEYGFREVATQEFVCHGRTYIFDAYRMRDPLAAYGVWSIRRPVGAEGLAAFPHSACSAYQCMLAHGPYYIEVVAYEATAETCNEIEHLVELAVRDLEPALMTADPTGQPPLALLPAAQRIAGSERLARGPVSLRTALRRAAVGPLADAIAQVQATLSDQEREWVLADYHAREDSTGAIVPQTTLVILAAEGAPAAERRLEAAGKAIPAGQALERIEAPPGWLANPREDPAWFACVIGGRLWLGTSQLPPARLRAWIEMLHKEG